MCVTLKEYDIEKMDCNVCKKVSECVEDKPSLLLIRKMKEQPI